MCGMLQALRDILLRPGEVTAGQPEVAQAGEEVHGVAPLHPVTRGWIVRQTVDPVEVFLGQYEVALQQKDVAQIEFRIGDHLRIPPLSGLLQPPDG